MKQIVLASGSPRRKELLEQLGLEFEVRPAHGDEIITKTEPEEVVRELASCKAGEIADQFLAEYHDGSSRALSGEPLLVIGADTIVVYENQIFGKPADEREAVRMLELLQGNTHQVYTGVCVMTLFTDKEDADKIRITSFAEKTEVTMYPVSPSEIEAYIATGEPADKAGAYAIQGIGARFIRKIGGDYYNVVGLPIARLWQECFKG